MSNTQCRFSLDCSLLQSHVEKSQYSKQVVQTLTRTCTHGHTLAALDSSGNSISASCRKPQVICTYIYACTHMYIYSHCSLYMRRNFLTLGRMGQPWNDQDRVVGTEASANLHHLHHSANFFDQHLCLDKGSWRFISREFSSFKKCRLFIIFHSFSVGFS